jgi:hypothetical protein
VPRAVPCAVGPVRLPKLGIFFASFLLTSVYSATNAWFFFLNNLVRN